MSHLILDIGNTRTKVAVFADGKMQTLTTCQRIDRDEITTLCRQHGVTRAIASVVGEAPDFELLLPADVMSHFHRFSVHSRMPVSIDYDTPQTLGVDRLAAVVGAHTMAEGTPLLVIDAGTCITIDLLDDANCYQGGAILPGLQMKYNALNHFTASLPLVELAPDERNGHRTAPLTGKSTRESILAGVGRATVYEIQGFIEEYKKRYPDIKLFLTGGDADFFVNQLFFPTFAVPNLVLIGLDKLLELNT